MRKDLDLKNSRLDRLIYLFRGDWWTWLSLVLAIIILGYLFVSVMDIKTDENYAPVIIICTLFIWGVFMQLPEKILFFIRDKI